MYVYPVYLILTTDFRISVTMMSRLMLNLKRSVSRDIFFVSAAGDAELRFAADTSSPHLGEV